MTKSDYNIIIGIFLIIILICAMGASIEKLESRKGMHNWFGISVSLPFITILMTVACLYRYVFIKGKMQVVHIFFLILCILIHFGYVPLYYFVVQKFDNYSGFNVGLAYLFIIPGIFEIMIFVTTISKRKRMDSFTITILVFFCLGIIGMCIYLWVFVNKVAGIISLIAVVLVIYIAIMFWTYIKY